MSQDVLGIETREGAVEQLTELQAAVSGTAATLHLYKSSFSPSPTNVEADFIAEECTFSGYAAAPITFGAVGLDSAGNAAAFATRIEFQNTTNVIGDSVGGAWMSVQSAPGPPVVNKSVRYYPFPLPIPMSAALAVLGAIVVVNAPNLNGKIIVDN